MNEEKTKNKKKILTYYLILGACILVIAAITLTVIFAVNGNKKISLEGDVTGNGEISGNGEESNNAGGSTDDSTVNGGDSQSGGSEAGNNSGSGTDDGTVNGNLSDNTSDNTTVSTKYEFVSPVETVDLINSYTFYKNNTLNYYHFHTGLDFAAEAGTAVYSCLDGTVESITTGDVLDGTVITIAHDNGVKTVYKFIDAEESLQVGDSVKRGQLIGSIAEANGSEYKDGAHLHFEVLKDGKADNPEDYLDITSK